MLECKQIINLLSELIDEELETDIAPDIKQHIFNCQYCNSTFNTYRTAIDLLHSMSMINVPLKVHRQLWKVIHIEIRQKKKIRRK